MRSRLQPSCNGSTNSYFNALVQADIPPCLHMSADLTKVKVKYFGSMNSCTSMWRPTCDLQVIRFPEDDITPRLVPLEFLWDERNDRPGVFPSRWKPGEVERVLASGRADLPSLLNWISHDRTSLSWHRFWSAISCVHSTTNASCVALCPMHQTLTSLGRAQWIGRGSNVNTRLTLKEVRLLTTSLATTSYGVGKRKKKKRKKKEEKTEVLFWITNLDSFLTSSGDRE